MAKKFPGENNLTQIFQLIEERYNFLKELISDAASKTYIIKPISTLTTSGLSLTLPSDVTYANIDNAVNKGLHVLMVLEFPSEAGADFSGNYVIPFTKKMETSGHMYFSTTVRNILMWGLLDTSGKLTHGYYYIENQGNKVTSLSTSSTHTQYPSAKAVYDALGGLTLKVATSAPTVDDRSVITFVVEG